MNTTVLCLGKLKENYLRDAAAEYIKRLSPYGKFTLLELPPERLPESPSENEIGQALAAEAARLIPKIPKNAFVVSLCVEGKQLSSEELSAVLQKAALTGKSEAVFIIGSSYGLSETVKQKSDLRLSFSKMTFPHQLMRVMLLEQLYRAEQIASGGHYHK